jgi:DNA primase
MIAKSLKILEHYHLLEDAKLVSADVEIKCPFHDDTNPSCRVWLEDETYYCISCGAKGDLADLVCRLENTNKIGALVVITRIMKDMEDAYDVEQGAKIILARKQPKFSEPEVLKQAEDFFFSLDKPSWLLVSHHYLIDKRGFTPRTLKRFDFRNNASSEFPIIFPVYENGLFRGYMTRALDDRKDKYRISKGMRKTEIVFGRVYPGKPVIVTEGPFDAMKTWQNLRTLRMGGGELGIASPLNWSTSERQAEKLAVASAILVAFDNDEAGRGGYDLMRRRLGVARPVVQFPIPKWIHDMAELEPREFQAGLAIARKALGSK